ncbi:hypothetical protein Mal15_51440 [Stieleria maiorica]|uniref:SxtJ n=1 Tax=Stieleria maiorica TaxID=2795974 RepID=A0A5B9MQ44_9BACT|nr:hypothetical protein [Stieleria maiorica]QEG01068.1 hypothetical protein Mal15_51440 [Stieleria maiorica]
MAVVKINWSPTDRQLRQFGVICLFAFPLFGWLWNAGSAALSWLTLAGLILAGFSIVVPAAVRPLYLALTLVTSPIGMVLGEIVMSIVYFGVFLPIGVWFRVMKRDALQLKVDRKSSTYWQPKKQSRDVKSYFRQS